MSGCYPGCFYYTDSCFRKDCKMTQAQAHKPAHGGYPSTATRSGPEFSNDKDRAVAGGLQAHSVGDIYPCAVVGYQTDCGTTFRVENLQTGQTWCGMEDDKPFARYYTTALGAEKSFAQYATRRWVFPHAWAIKPRP